MKLEKPHCCVVGSHVSLHVAVVLTCDYSYCLTPTALGCVSRNTRLLAGALIAGLVPTGRLPSRDFVQRALKEVDYLVAHRGVLVDAGVGVSEWESARAKCERFDL